MNPILLAQLMSSVGTIGLPLVEKILADIEAGRTATTVTSADVKEVNRLSQQNAEDIFARFGVTPPMAPAPKQPTAVA